MAELKTAVVEGGRQIAEGMTHAGVAEKAVLAVAGGAPPRTSIACFARRCKACARWRKGFSVGGLPAIMPGHGPEFRSYGLRRYTPDWGTTRGRTRLARPWRPSIAS
jgi:hypothetical protein